MKRYNNYKDSGIEWTGEIPEHWKAMKLKYISDVVLGKMLTPDDKGEYHLKPYLRAKNIEWNTVNVEDVKEMWFSDKELTQYGIREHDILVSEGGEVGRACIWKNELAECYIQNSVHKITTNKNIIPKFLLHQFVLYGFKGHFEAIVNKISIAHLTKEKLLSVDFIIPPLSEQTAIAAYLDSKTAQLDELISKKERLIELLNEERTAIINHAVTKGINPNVPLKDSGIEWLGEIPEHWEVKKIKQIFSLVGGGTPTKDNKKYWGGSIPWVSPKDMKVDFISTTEDYITEQGLKESSSNLIEKDSLLMVVRSGILQRTIPIAITAVDLTINQDIKAFKPSNSILANFFYFYIKGNESILRNIWVKQGATVESIDIEVLNNDRIFLPSIQEQNEIVNFIKDHWANIEKTINLNKKEIDLLKEYKTALISEVVTGKVKVV